MYLLQECIKNPLFIEESKSFGKGLVLDLLKEKEIESSAVSMVIDVLNDTEVRYELKELLKWAAS